MSDVQSSPNDSNADYLLIKEIERKMAALAAELRHVLETTESVQEQDVDIEFRGPGFMDISKLVKTMHGIGEDANISESKQLAAKSYRMAKTLLEIYDVLGPIALAETVINIRTLRENSEKPINEELPQPKPIFRDAVKEIFAKNYGSEFLAIDAQPEHQQSRRTFLKAIGTSIALGSAWSRYTTCKNSAKAGKELTAAREKQIDLESEPVLTKEQKKQMLTLQRIEIPQLEKKQGNASSWQWADVGMVAGTAMLLFAVVKDAQADPHEIEFGQVGSAKTTMALLDEFICDLCTKTRPAIRGIQIPPAGDGRGR